MRSSTLRLSGFYISHRSSMAATRSRRGTATPQPGIVAMTYERNARKWSRKEARGNDFQQC